MLMPVPPHLKLGDSVVLGTDGVPVGRGCRVQHLLLPILGGLRLIRVIVTRLDPLIVSSTWGIQQAKAHITRE